MLNGAEGLTYNGAAQEPGVTAAVNGQPLAAENNYTVTYADNTNAGTATVTVTGTSFTGTVEKTFSIGKATLTITANDQTITYGESIAQGTDQVTLATLCPGDTLQSVTLAAAGTDITPSAAQIQNASGADVTGNYDIDYQAGTLTILKSRPEISFNENYKPSKCAPSGPFPICKASRDGSVHYRLDARMTPGSAYRLLYDRRPYSCGYDCLCPPANEDRRYGSRFSHSRSCPGSSAYGHPRRPPIRSRICEERA